jgi:hypothetical protein
MLRRPVLGLGEPTLIWATTVTFDLSEPTGRRRGSQVAVLIHQRCAAYDTQLCDVQVTLTAR